MTRVDAIYVVVWLAGLALFTACAILLSGELA